MFHLLRKSGLYLFFHIFDSRSSLVRNCAILNTPGVGSYARDCD
jgi:hypothetical protein